MTLLKRWFGIMALILGFASPAAAQGVAPVLGDAPLGAEQAPITIVEYASLTCPHCASFHNETLPRLKQEWIDTGKARLIFRDFPFDQAALRASMLARCAGAERYHGFLSVLFKQQRSWATQNFMPALQQIARLGGMSDADFNACMENKAVEEAVLANRLKGEQEAQVTSTPTFIINGQKHSGALPYEEFQKLLTPLQRTSTAAAQTEPRATPPATPTPVPPQAVPAPAAEQPGGLSIWLVVAVVIAAVVLIGGFVIYKRKSGP